VKAPGTARHLVGCFAFWLLFPVPPARAQTPSAEPADRAARVVELLNQLRQPTSTFDPPSIARYLALRDRVTGEVLDEVDAFVTDHVVPGKASEPQVKADLDMLLRHVPHSSMEATSAFLVNLWTGRYLVIGIDIPRIGDGPDDAMWLRAYRDDGVQFVRVAAAEFVQDRPLARGGDGRLLSLNVTGLEPLSASHFWFVAMAHRHQGDRGTVVLRIGRFDGDSFVLVAVASDFFASVSPTVRPLLDGGFTVHRRASRNGKRIVERYGITERGPLKVDEWDDDGR